MKTIKKFKVPNYPTKYALKEVGILLLLGLGGLMGTLMWLAHWFKVTREDKLILLRQVLKKITDEFIMWGATDLKMAEDMDMILTEIEEIEKTLQLEEEILENIKKKVDK